MRKTVIIIISGMFFLIMPGAIRNGFGAVPYTFTFGTTAKAAEVNANFSDLDTRIGSLEGGQQGSTTSAGCIDKSPSAPDCSACVACVIGAAAYPSGGWVYLAKYTLPEHGEVVVSVDDSVVCRDTVADGTVLGVSLAIADGAGFPPADPASGVIAYTELTLGPGRQTYEVIPWKTPMIVGRIMTQGALTPGTTYKIFLFETTVSGTVSGDCAFRTAPVYLRFTPLPAASVTITPN